jgi:hypothetical protein
VDSQPSASGGFFLGLLFNPENGSDMFLRNDGFSPRYTALQPRRAALNSHRRENLKSKTSGQIRLKFDIGGFH